MNKPTDKELKEVLNALVTNGFDFLERSAAELVQEQKFSIAHFATGLELLLKAGLFREHWTLIGVHPHSCAWTSVKDGSVRTIQASDLCGAITSTTGEPLKHQDKAFRTVFDHRNRVLHWAPDGDLTATVAEQCRAWHHLRGLLTDSWQEDFAPYKNRIEKIEKLLLAHRSYLDVRFEQQETKLTGMGKARRLLSCPSCNFRSGVAEKSEDRVVPFECLVCGFQGSAARFACRGLFALDDLPVLECECGERHDRQDLLDELDPTPALSPKEMSTYEADRGHCGECSGFEATVAPDGAGYICVACGTRFDSEDSSHCEHCDTRWFGWDNEGSGLSGCELCEGPDIDDD